MTEYKGFSYEQIDEGKWILKLPSGLKSKVSAKDEDDLKAKIDALSENNQISP